MTVYCLCGKLTVIICDVQYLLLTVTFDNCLCTETSIFIKM